MNNVISDNELDKILNYNKQKLLKRHPDIHPIGWTAFSVGNRLFDSDDKTKNLRQAIAWSIVKKIIKNERSQ